MWRRVGLTLIALGLALRIAIAPGMMPVATSQGVELTLCTAQGPVTYTLDIHGEKPAKQAHDPCPYGAMAAAPLLPAALPLALPLAIATSALAVLFPAALNPHVGAPAPPPSTGPPASL